MKKVLLATSILVAGASFASAEVTLSGDARMGLISDFGGADTTFTSRARVKFTLSGESDSGLSFGADFRPQDAAGAAAGTAGSVFVSGAFGKLTMGDIDGAAKAAVGNVDGVGLTGLGDLNELTYIAGGVNTDLLAEFGAVVPAVAIDLTADPSAMYEYSAGAFTAYASITKPGFTTTIAPTVIDGDAYAIGGKYSMDAYTFALGYEALDLNDAATGAGVAEFDHVVASASGTFSGVTVKAAYGKGSGGVIGVATLDLKQYAVSATYGADALKGTVYASSKTFENTGVVTTKTTAIGIGASYDLGGGASVVGGIAREKDGLTGVSDTAYDVGLSFSF